MRGRAIVAGALIAGTVGVVTTAGGAARKGGEHLYFNSEAAAYKSSVSGEHRQRLARNAAGVTAGPEGEIAFAREHGHIHNDDIYIADADGGHVRKLTHGVPIDGDPSFSPSGRRIAFHRKGEIWVISRAGRNEKQLTPSNESHYSPAYSPDGKTLAFDGAGDGLFTMRSSGGKIRRLSDARAYSPSFSPDGKRIIFYATVGDDPPFPTQIFTINRDGTHLVAVTDGTGDVSDPVYSPDGKRIAYTQHAGRRDSQIVIADADGSDPHVAVKNAYNVSWVR